MTWGARADAQAAPGAPLPPHGKPLGKLGYKDFEAVVEKGLLQYSEYRNSINHKYVQKNSAKFSLLPTGRECRDLDIVVFKEVLDNVAHVDRVLTMPGGSLLMAGRSGVGRRTAVTLVAHMHQMSLFTPKVSRTYGVKHFKNDLKTVR